MENAINKEGVALVLVYGDGRKYIQFMGFTKNQTIREDREAISEIPTPVKTPEENGSLSGETPGQINIKQIKLRFLINFFILSNSLLFTLGIPHGINHTNCINNEKISYKKRE